MSDKIFLDTNVLVYAFGSDSSKRQLICAVERFRFCITRTMKWRNQ